MKTKNLRITNITLISLISLIFVAMSCETLEEEPFSEVGSEFFYEDAGDAVIAVNAVYAQLKSGNGYYRQQFLSNMHAASDLGPSSWRHGDFRRGTIESPNPMLERSWIDIYVCIKDANNVINRVPEIPEMDEELRKRVIGEARFIRALSYFNLVRCFGEVPLRTEPVEPGEDGLPVSSIQDIYQVIIDDFTYAAENCWGYNESRNGFNNDVGRVTKAAAHAMLTKVYLRIASSMRTAQQGIQGNALYADFANSPDYYYQKAVEQANMVLQRPFYQLISGIEQYENLFDANNGNNSEFIFEVQGASIAGQGTAISNLFSPQNSGLAGGGWGGVNRLMPLFINNSINKEDPRFKNTIINSFEDERRSYVLGPNSTGYQRTDLETGESAGTLFRVFTAKYIDRQASTEYTSQQNWHVVRLADVYLMRAEALVELNGDPSLANDDFNTLRSRVGMDNIDVSGLSMQDFRTQLLRERAAELYMEGHRFFDLTRLGVYDEYCKITWGNTDGQRGPDDYTWPIPLIETSSNPNISN
jgi:hypothetical protein